MGLGKEQGMAWGLEKGQGRERGKPWGLGWRGRGTLPGAACQNHAWLLLLLHALSLRVAGKGLQDMAVHAAADGSVSILAAAAGKKRGRAAPWLHCCTRGCLSMHARGRHL